MSIPTIPADKGTHIVVCCVLTQLIASGCAATGYGLVHQLLLTAIAVLAATIIKELIWDKLLKRGTPDAHDAMANAWGWGLGIWGWVAPAWIGGGA